MQSSGQQGSGPEGAHVSDSSPPPPPPPPFENVRDFDLWPVKHNCEDEGPGVWLAKNHHQDLDGMRRKVCTLGNVEQI